jgi:23S rRNA pseudouridine1911/1915/1917 synthase
VTAGDGGEAEGAGLRRGFRAGPDDVGERLDRALARHFAGFLGVSRVLVRGWIDEGRVALNGRPVRPAARLAAGDAVEVLLPIGPPPPAPVPQEVPFAVLYEDEHLLAIDKPAGLVVHPSPGHREVTVLHGLLWRWQQAGGEGEPHLVQRLDRGTSGVLLVAKRGEVHAALSRLLSEPSASKEYLACVYGRPRLERGRIDLAVGLDPTDRRRRVAAVAEGRPSTTFYREIAVSQGERAGLTLLGCRLGTGRTHQIRVHLQAVGLPLVGDPLYGAPGWRGIADPDLAEHCRSFPRQALHAWRLEVLHPVTGERLEITAPPPADFASLLAAAGLPES